MAWLDISYIGVLPSNYLKYLQIIYLIHYDRSCQLGYYTVGLLLLYSMMLCITVGS